MSQLITLDFSANVITALGEEVFICGNIPELGSWDPNKSFQLFTNADLYPEWKNRRSLKIPSKVSLQFKLLIKSSIGTIRWEKLQENRKLVPTQSLLVNIQEAKMVMAFDPLIQLEIAQVPRKNTCEIIQELSDQVSESSSGNQRQFWKEMGNKQRTSVNKPKQFTSNAKAIFFSWKETITKIKDKPVKNQAQIIPSIHFVIKKQVAVETEAEGNRKKVWCSVKPEVRQNQEPFELTIGLDGQQKLIENYPENKLKIFHLRSEDSDISIEVIKKVKDKYKGFVVYYPTQSISNDPEHLIDFADVFVVKNKRTLVKTLQILKNKGQIKANNQNEFIIKKDETKAALVYFEIKQSVQNSQQRQSSLLLALQKKLQISKWFHLPCQIKLFYFMDGGIVREVNKNNFCIVVVCQKIQQIDQKIITKLIRISSSPNISIQIWTCDEYREIAKRLPVSQKDKILVYNRQGDVIKSGIKVMNLYQQTKTQIKGYKTTFRQILQNFNFWVLNKEIEFIEKDHFHEMILSKNQLGEILSDSIMDFVANLSKSEKNFLECSKYIKNNNIVLHFSPILSSMQFYSRVVIESNQSFNKNTYFLCFDYTKDKYGFSGRMQQRRCQNVSNIQCFIIGQEQTSNRLWEEKLEQFLRSLEIEVIYFNSINNQDPQILSKSAIKYRQKDVFQQDLSKRYRN